MNKTHIVIIILALIALVVGVNVGHYYFKPKAPADTAATVLTPPQPIAQFSLLDSQGRPFNNNSLWGHWTFMFFGFTNCPNICPPTMNDLSKMYATLLQAKQNPMPQVVFVSVDPQRDTLDKIGQYVTSFDPHFQGVTGDPKQLDALTSSLNILVLKSKDKNTQQPAIDHSGAIVLVDPAGKLTAVFSMPHDPQMMAKDFKVILANAG